MRHTASANKPTADPEADIRRKPDQGQFALFRQRRFLPFFLTQFLGAFNDNIFKNSLILLLTFGTLINADEKLSLYTNAAALLFILPFFLFSATAGQIADKFEKSALIRKIKLFEILIMILATAAFYMESVTALMAVLFLMGAQSSFFGPVKYSIIPQHLHANELVGGNALVESGTFLAILVGTIFAGILQSFDTPLLYISFTVIGFSILGYYTSRAIPTAPAVAPELKINWNLISQTINTISFTREKKPVFISIMGISWFWFLGAAYLTQFPEYSKTLLGGDDGVVILLLTTFSMGIGAGSLLCEKLSGHKVELGLVPLGSIGLTVFGIDLGLQTPPPIADELRSITEFLLMDNAIRTLLDMACIGLFGGFYIVPLYAMIQERSDPAVRSRIIAGNNIFNALFMVASAATGFFLLGFAGLSIPDFFLTIAIMNLVFAIFIYAQVPEFPARFIMWLLAHTLYRLRHINLYHIPAKGPAILICNPVSYVDTLLIGSVCRRPVRFVMLKPIYDLPTLNFVLRTGKAPPVTSTKAYDQISAALKNDELICVFSEENLTTNGEIDDFNDRIHKIIKRDSVPILPMALCERVKH